ncbi:hypothetical protein DERP_000525 [Dermatophagoides pteronyssinus]|uniref:Uncharacterized protein n=1 Tax=Dermatophagoides pteronyssinus TaxID=6956 RepID=A0ABQ8J0G3_DERPT|nr:hypothetical protein DERP_000525 [Dermatophagoides pteronyssinus]
MFFHMNSCKESKQSKNIVTTNQQTKNYLSSSKLYHCHSHRNNYFHCLSKSTTSNLFKFEYDCKFSKYPIRHYSYYNLLLHHTCLWIICLIELMNIFTTTLAKDNIQPYYHHNRRPIFIDFNPLFPLNTRLNNGGDNFVYHNLKKNSRFPIAIIQHFPLSNDFNLKRQHDQQHYHHTPHRFNGHRGNFPIFDNGWSNGYGRPVLTKTIGEMKKIQLDEHQNNNVQWNSNDVPVMSQDRHHNSLNKNDHFSITDNKDFEKNGKYSGKINKPSNLIQIEHQKTQSMMQKTLPSLITDKKFMSNIKNGQNFIDNNIYVNSRNNDSDNRNYNENLDNIPDELNHSSNQIKNVISDSTILIKKNNNTNNNEQQIVWDEYQKQKQSIFLLEKPQKTIPIKIQSMIDQIRTHPMSNIDDVNNNDNNKNIKVVPSKTLSHSDYSTIDRGFGFIKAWAWDRGTRIVTEERNRNENISKKMNNENFSQKKNKLAAKNFEI